MAGRRLPCVLIGTTAAWGVASVVAFRQAVFLPDGTSCGGRTYGFGPNGGVATGVGEVSPATREALNAACRSAAAGSWWLAVACALMSLGTAVVGAAVITRRAGATRSRARRGAAGDASIEGW